MIKLNNVQIKARAIYNKVPINLLDNGEMLLLKGGLTAAICGAGDTLKASDFPDVEQHICMDGATLTNIIVGGSGLNDPIANALN